jgi:O-antigen/teichoic acid export membrane protein
MALALIGVERAEIVLGHKKVQEKAIGPDVLDENSLLKSANFIQYSFQTLLAQISVTVLGVVLTVLSARFLGPEGKGILSVLILLPVLAVTFGRLGIGNSIIYHAPRISHPHLISNGFLLISVIGALVSVLALAFVLLLRNSLFKNISPSWLILMCVMIIFFFLYDFIANLFIALYKINLRNRMAMLFPAANIVLFIIFVIVMKGKVKGAIGAWSLAVIFSVIVSWRWLTRKTVWRGGRFDFAFMKQLLRFGVKSHIGTLLELLNYRADYLLVNLYAGPFSVGLYSCSVNMAETAWKLPEAAAIVLLPNVARMPLPQAQVLTQKICRMVLFLVFVFCIFLVIFRKTIILILFGKAFLPSAEPLLILLPGFIAFALWKILAYGLLAQGYPQKYSLTSGLAFITMIILDFLFIPQKGIAGAAWASTIAYFFATIVVIGIYARMTKTHLKALFIPQKSDFGALIGYFLERARFPRINKKKIGRQSI